MGADTAIQLPSAVAVEAEDLIARREAMFSQPIMQFPSCADFFAMSRTSTLDMIDGEKEERGLSTARAATSAIGVENSESRLCSLPLPDGAENLRLRLAFRLEAARAVGLSAVGRLRPSPKIVKRLVRRTSRAAFHSLLPHGRVLSAKGRRLPGALTDGALAFPTITGETTPTARCVPILRPSRWAKLGDRLGVMAPETFLLHNNILQSLTA